MKTNQLMKRDFMASQITQRTLDKFFNATELLSIYNEKSNVKKVLPEFWSNKSTKSFIEVLEIDINSNIGNSLYLKTHETTRGKNGATWMHPFLFIKFAIWLSPEFELQIIKWVYDNLIDVRNNAGDHYREMCECIKDNYQEIKGKLPNPYIFSNEARFLNKLCYNSNESGKRNELTEKELRLLNELQLLNIHLINNKISNEKRKEILTQHSINYKLINK